MATSGNASVNIWASALAIAAVIALFRFRSGTLQALFALSTLRAPLFDRDNA